VSFGEVSRFDWVRDSAIGEAGCITLVTPADLTAVAAAFGGDLSQGGEGVLADGLSGPGAPTALVRHIGDWVLVVENNGFEGSRSEVLRRLPGRAVSMFWNVNAATEFSYAVNGTVLTTFEALFPDYPTGAQPNALSAHFSGLPWRDLSVDSVSLMLALAARLTGVAVQPEDLAGPMMLVPLVPWPEDKPQRVSPRHEPLTYADPAVSYALQHTDEARLWAVARAAVRIATEVAGLGDDPTLLAVIDGSAGTAERAALDEMARELEPAQLWPSFRAVEAARAACGPNALAAAFRAVTEADRGTGGRRRPSHATRRRHGHAG
jgi:hypothetical protein